MKPSSAMAFVSAMPGVCCSASAALDMESWLGAQQNSKTATLAVTKILLNHFPLVFFVEPMQCFPSGERDRRVPSGRSDITTSRVACGRKNSFIPKGKDIVLWYNGPNGRRARHNLVARSDAK
jgi:hypothetical protein